MAFGAPAAMELPFRSKTRQPARQSGLSQKQNRTMSMPLLVPQRSRSNGGARRVHITAMALCAKPPTFCVSGKRKSRGKSLSTAEQKPAIGRRKTRPLALLRAGNVGRA
jgi:hypothetical protein